MGSISPIDHDLALCILNETYSPARDPFQFYRDHIARQANEKFPQTVQFFERMDWIVKATAYVHTLFQLAAEFDLDDREAINYLLNRTVYLHTTIQ